MNRSLRHALRLAFLALSLPVLGCDLALSSLTVEIPDFSSKQVEGIWVWRLSPQTNQYQRDTQIRFEGVTTLASGQTLTYATNTAGGVTNATFETGVVPDPADPDRVTVKLGFVRGLPGVFKVTTYNAAGESPLSSGSDSL
ncbi:MAG TPA: hypothetical protein VEG67_05580 [Myxococcota bacterium]|nr:hypothetical protein [Myxococcota bacterium]